MRRVVVVGAGFAGLAAAWSARRRGADVTLVSTGPGASELSSGALDDASWETMATTARALGERPTCGPLAEDVQAVCAELRIYRVPASGDDLPVLAATSGGLRPARGHDRALLDVGALRSGCVYLPRVGRAGWDADALAAALSDHPLARDRALSFRAFDAQVLRHAAEWRSSDADLAILHDDDARLAWLGARLAEASRAHAREARGFLLGPWLGAAEPHAAALTALLGLPVGEALVGVGSPAGLRFAAARARFVATVGAELVEARVEAITRADGRWRVSLADDRAPRVADAVVLACGGVGGGGVVYLPAESAAVRDLPPHAVVPFRLSLEADAVMALRGRRLGATSSLHGPALDDDAWPRGQRAGALEAAGVLCDGVVVRSDETAPREDPLRAAGDVIADRPRTVLQAVASGVLAGAHASGAR